MKNELHIVLGDETRKVLELELMAEPPSSWQSDVRAGRHAWDLTDCLLRLDGGKARRVYWDGAPFVVHNGGKLQLGGALLDAFKAETLQLWRAVDVPPRKRRAPGVTMPETVTSDIVTGVMSWPLGNVKTHTSAGEGWTDCLIVFVEAIRTGGKYNSRRVRYDGRFYIMYNNVKRYVTGALVFDVLDVASHVYGIDAESDKMHNKTLKGY